MTRFRVFALVAALALTTACGGKSDTPLEQAENALVIGITVMSNNAQPEEVYKVPKGKDVRLRVYSTITDTVHVQGYEKTGPVEAGGYVQVEFIADKAGRFDVEMQRSGRKLIQLRVS